MKIRAKLKNSDSFIWELWRVVGFILLLAAISLALTFLLALGVWLQIFIYCSLFFFFLLVFSFDWIIEK